MIKSSERKHFMDGFCAENDTELVQEVYRRSDESSRLTKSKAASVEFWTTVRYIEKYLKPGANILDIGAGAGEYTCILPAKDIAYRRSSLPTPI